MMPLEIERPFRQPQPVSEGLHPVRKFRFAKLR
jgi:hypothetical protein